MTPKIQAQLPVWGITILVLTAAFAGIYLMYVWTSNLSQGYTGTVVSVIPDHTACRLWILPCATGPDITVRVNGTTVALNDDVCGVDYQIGDNITVTWNQNWTTGPYWQDQSCFL